MAVTPYFMVTNRQVLKDDLTQKRVDKLSFFTSKGGVDLKKFELAANKRCRVRRRITRRGGQVSRPARCAQFKQKHVSLFVHGYNNDWQGSAARYMQIKKDRSKPTILACWGCSAGHRYGSSANYLPDREDARQSGPQTAELFVRLHEIVAAEQRLAAISNDPTRCAARRFPSSRTAWVTTWCRRGWRWRPKAAQQPAAHHPGASARDGRRGRG